jgi:hypothetical protein
MKNNNNSLGISFTNIMQLFGFEQIIKEPTRVTENCSSIIDFILCNKPENIVKSGSICVGLSDHNIIYCCRKIKRTTSGKKQFQFSFTGFVSLHFVQSILFNYSTKLAVLYFFKHLILMFVCLPLVVLLIFLQQYIIL